jgi:aryl-alcohol dehydrogenase-like predicted oxidoreductase
MEPHELVDGYAVSPIIKGGWQLATDHSDDRSATPVEDMFAFVDRGITTFDCADIYTGVETLIGEFRATYERRHGEPAPINVHTKFVPDRSRLGEVSPEYVERIVDRSRERLGVETLDLVQFHWWDFDTRGYVDAARTLADLRDRGKIAHVGVTNFDRDHLAELVDAGVPVVSNQVQYSLLDRRPERKLADYCRENDIGLLCYGSLAGGFLTDAYRGEPEPVGEMENRSLTKYELIIEEAGGWERYQALLEVLAEVAAKHDASIANVASAFVLDRPGVRAVIVGARNTDHLDDTVRTPDLDLTPEDVAELEAAADELRDVPGEVYDLEREPGGRHAEIMKYELNEE